MRIINKDLKWQNDRDIPKRIWNTYMKQFGDRYRLERDQNNIWHIKCKFGLVQLHSITKQQLCYIGDYRSTRHKNSFKKKCCFKHTIMQEGDTDIVIVFNEKILDSTAQALRFYKKKKISDEYRSMLAARMLEIRKLRHLEKS